MVASATGHANGGDRRRHVLVIGGDLAYLFRFRSELLVSIASLGYRVTAATPDEVTSRPPALIDVGVHCVRISMSRTGTNPLRDAPDVVALTRWIRRLAPDVVFAYGAKPIAYGLLAAKLAGIRERYAMLPGLGYAFIDDERPSLARRATRIILSNLYRLALAGCQRVIFQNHDDRDEFLARRLVDGARSLVVNGSGVDLDTFVASPVPTDPPRFLFIGRLLRSKGVHELVRAARIVRREIPRAEFHLVGAHDTNPDRADPLLLQAHADSCDIVLHGQVEDVRPLLAACTAFVLPSYREGVPRSGLEALAAGRTTIVADAPGCRTIVREGRHGALVRPRDAEDLARVLIEYASDPRRAASEGREARITAESDYDVRNVNEAMLDALRLRT